MTEDEKREFAAGLARAGLTLPPERLELMKAAFLGYRALAMELNAPLPADIEPLGLFVPAPADARSDKR
jgi:hypothetical protein